MTASTSTKLVGRSKRREVRLAPDVAPPEARLADLDPGLAAQACLVRRCGRGDDRRLPDVRAGRDHPGEVAKRDRPGLGCRLPTPANQLIVLRIRQAGVGQSRLVVRV